MQASVYCSYRIYPSRFRKCVKTLIQESSECLTFQPQQRSGSWLVKISISPVVSIDIDWLRNFPCSPTALSQLALMPLSKQHQTDKPYPCLCFLEAKAMCTHLRILYMCLQSNIYSLPSSAVDRHSTRGLHHHLKSGQ